LIVNSGWSSIVGLRQNRLQCHYGADSDEVARVKRDEAARDSWMMSPAVTE
jgi:hypothetical protein